MRTTIPSTQNRRTVILNNTNDNPVKTNRPTKQDDAPERNYWTDAFEPGTTRGPTKDYSQIHLGAPSASTLLTEDTKDCSVNCLDTAAELIDAMPNEQRGNAQVVFLSDNRPGQEGKTGHVVIRDGDQIVDPMSKTSCDSMDDYLEKNPQYSEVGSLKAADAQRILDTKPGSTERKMALDDAKVPESLQHMMVADPAPTASPTAQRVQPTSGPAPSSTPAPKEFEPAKPLSPSIHVSPQHQGSAETAAKIISDKEGDYDHINVDDGGASSIGKLQWNGTRAYDLLEKMLQSNPELTKEKLAGTNIVSELEQKNDTLWTNRVLNSDEQAKVKDLLTSEVGKKTQDEQIVKDVQGYMDVAAGLGITDPKAQAYFADCYNQSPAEATAIAQSCGNDKSLDSLYRAATQNSILGKPDFQTRRNQVYEECKQANFAP